VLAVSTTAWWVLGYAIAGGVVLVAATLLLVIIALGRRIVRQAAEIEAALDGARENTNALFDLADLNHTVEAITRRLKALRGGEGPEDERGLLGQVASQAGRLLRGGGAEG
jgi:hypothetical protein